MDNFRDSVNQLASEQQAMPTNMPPFTVNSNHHDFIRLVNEIPLAVLILNNQGQVTFFNQQAQTIFPTIALGLIWVDVINAEVETSKCTYKAIYLRSGKYLSLKTCPIGDGSCQVIMLTDITEEERLQAQVEHQTRLSDMGKMAGALAHQIRTPLASAVLYVKNLLAAKKNAIKLSAEKEQHFLTKAASILDTMEEKIKDMLIFAKSQQITKADCLLNELVTSLAATIETKESVEINLDCDKAELNHVLHCNLILLVDAIDNCIDNATNAAATEINVTIEIVDEILRIAICDNGDGIPQDMLQKIIQPFVTTELNGTGLGLSVVKMIAEAHAGKLWITSEENTGTQINLELPILGESNGIDAARTAC